MLQPVLESSPVIAVGKPNKKIVLAVLIRWIDRSSTDNDEDNNNRNEGKDNENNTEHNDDDDNNKYFTVANQDLCKRRKRDAVKSSKCYNQCLNLHPS